MSTKEVSRNLSQSFHVVPRPDPQRLPFDVVQILRITNLLFKECTGVEVLFRFSPDALLQILKQWEDDRDFPLKIGSLAMCFDTKLDPLRTLLQSPDSSWRSVTLVMKWLEQEGQQPQMIQVWKDIIDIRNATVPIHEPQISLIKLYKSYGQTLPHVNFQELWIKILEEFLISLDRFCQFLNSKIYSQP